MTQIEIAQRNKKIKELALEGKIVDEIAGVFNMKRSRVMMILRSYKVKPGKASHQLHCEMAKKIIAELEKGTMQSEIAKKFNVSRQYVSQIKFKLQGK